MDLEELLNVGEPISVEELARVEEPLDVEELAATTLVVGAIEVGLL